MFLSLAPIQVLDLSWLYLCAAAGVVLPRALLMLAQKSSCGPNIVPVSHVCLEMPRAAVEQFPRQCSKLFFFLIHTKSQEIFTS